MPHFCTISVSSLQLQKRLILMPFPVTTFQDEVRFSGPCASSLLMLCHSQVNFVWVGHTNTRSFSTYLQNLGYQARRLNFGSAIFILVSAAVTLLVTP